MARIIRKPETNDTIRVEVDALDVEFSGTVVDLLDTQFTILVNTPAEHSGKTFFIFYSEPWKLTN